MVKLFLNASATFYRYYIMDEQKNPEETFDAETNEASSEGESMLVCKMVSKLIFFMPLKFDFSRN